MGNLPTPGSDTDVWGTELNAWLLADHDVDGTHSFNTFTAADHGLLAWNFDAAAIGSSTAVLTNTTLYLSRVNVRYAMSVFNVGIQVSAAGTSLTTGQNFAALFASTGTRVGVTADQTTNWATAQYWSMPLTSGPFSLSTGYYWVGVVVNGTGTNPQLARGGNGQAAAVNAGLTAATARAATATGGTSMPSSITPSSSTLTNNLFWCTLS